MPKTKYACTYCKKEFFRYSSCVRNINAVFCCRKCHATWAIENKIHAKENNANYGKKWTNEQRKKAGELISKRYDDPEYRYNIGKSNRGKKLSLEIRKKMSEGSIGVGLGYKHTEETKRLIGIKSKKKFEDQEYFVRIRKKMEEKGYWTPLEQKKDLDIYYEESNWISRMFNLIVDTEQIALLNKLHVFSYKNTKGVVRDHIYSRRSGFMQKVFPEILRHPCNCQLLTNADNIRKAFGNGKYKDSDHQTLENLFYKIENYNNEWIEQEVVLELITKYKNGDRWVNPYTTIKC